MARKLIGYTSWCQTKSNREENKKVLRLADGKQNGTRDSPTNSTSPSQITMETDNTPASTDKTQGYWNDGPAESMQTESHPAYMTDYDACAISSSSYPTTPSSPVVKPYTLGHQGGYGAESELFMAEAQYRDPGHLQGAEEDMMGNMTKEELRYFIQKRRRDSGLGDIEFDYPLSLNEQLTPEEEEKRRRRRERNKVAAQKCRLKKKESTEAMKKEFQNLECSNTELRYQVRMLEKEKNKLQDLLQAHLGVCDKGQELTQGQKPSQGQGQGRNEDTGD